MQIEKVVLENSALTLLKKSEDCFEDARSQHALATTMHDNADQQTENADRQKAIAVQQHVNADKVAAKADELGEFGSVLESDALQIMGDTMVVQAGVPPKPSGSAEISTSDLGVGVMASPSAS